MELPLGVGLTLLDGLGAGVESVEGRLDCTSRRRVAMRSTMDCRLVVLCSEAPDENRSVVGFGAALVPIRLPTLLEASELMLPPRDDEKDLSLEELRLWGLIVRLGDGVATDGRDGLGLTEGLGRLGLMDGLRLIDGLDRPKEGLGDGLGETDLDRLDIRSAIPPLGALALGAA